MGFVGKLYGFVGICAYMGFLEEIGRLCMVVFFCMYVWCFVWGGVGTNVEKALNWYQESS